MWLVDNLLILCLVFTRTLLVALLDVWRPFLLECMHFCQDDVDVLVIWDYAHVFSFWLTMMSQRKRCVFQSLIDSPLIKFETWKEIRRIYGNIVDI